MTLPDLEVQMVRVFHKIETDFTACLTWDLCEFHHVANVRVGGFASTGQLDDTYYCDRAYELTNSIDGPWWANDGVYARMSSPAFVEVRGKKGTRSTSVGDVMEYCGRRYVCDRIGWRRID